MIVNAILLFLLAWDGGILMDALKEHRIGDAILVGILMFGYCLMISYSIHKKKA